MVNRRIFVDEPDPPPPPEAPAASEEAQPQEKGWYEDVELAREWGRLADKGILVFGKIVGAVRSGEVAKFREEIQKLFVDWQAAQRAATGPAPPSYAGASEGKPSNRASNSGHPPAPNSEPTAPQSTAGKGEIVNMELRIDPGKLEAEIEKALAFIAAVPFMANKQVKDLPAMFEENRESIMKEVAKAIKSSLVYVAKDTHATP